jgi:hypothetical protein
MAAMVPGASNPTAARSKSPVATNDPFKKAFAQSIIAKLDDPEFLRSLPSLKGFTRQKTAKKYELTDHAEFLSSEEEDEVDF